MIQVQQFVNTELTSNTYLIKKASDNDAFFIDIGEYEKARDYVRTANLNVKALFLTHAHYDHIHGIQRLKQDFPDIEIWAHPYTIEALSNAKMNLSFYREEPVELKLFEGEANQIFDDEIYCSKIKVRSLQTPGHNLGSLSFTVDDRYLFTGDSLIPGHPVVTKLKSGDKPKAKESLLTVFEHMRYAESLFPGHGAPVPKEKFKQLKKEQTKFNL